MPVAGVLNERVLTWFARTGGDTLKLQRHDHQAGYNEAFSWLGSLGADSRPAMERAEKVEDDRRLIASAPPKARRLALSQHEVLDPALSETYNPSNTPKNLLQSVSDFCERTLSIPGLLPNSVLDQWDQPLIFPRHRGSAHALRFLSKRARFRLVIDPPEGEELAAWTAMKKKEIEEADFDGRFLTPPPRQKKKRDRKSGRPATSKYTQLST